MATRPIDEKIVVMKLDNSDFAAKAADTTSKLGRLKEALNKIPGVNLGKTVQDLGSIQNAANNTTLDRLASSVQTVAGQFSALKVMATTALATVTSMATQAGVSMAKSLTLDQVTDGFREYELKIGAIGTMLSNTEWAGSDLNDVKATLGELNTYADQTIYSFADMTQNIGRFTAAGVRLEDSAIAIKGLGNLAAASGAGVEQLNSAMYQSSQALASGKLNLEDWNSLVNAGMAGKKTQDALVATAKAMGKNVDLSEGFRNSIQDGWLTSEVYLKTLQKFGADKSMTEAATSVRTFTGMIASLKEGIGSGWAQTWETIFGDFEEATEFWTEMSTNIGGFFAKSTKARNDLIQGIDDKGGIIDIFEGIGGAASALGQVFKAVSAGFKQIFPPMSINQIIKMTSAFRDWGKGLKLNKETMGQLTTIFAGAFSIFSTVFEIAKQLGGAFLKLIPPGTGGGVLDLLEKIAKLAISFNESVKEGNALTSIIDGLGSVLSVVGGVVGGLISGVIDLAGGFRNILGASLEWIGDKLSKLSEFFKDTFSTFGGDDLLGAGTLTGIVVVVASVIGKIQGLFNNFDGIVEGFADAMEGVGDALQNFAMGVKIANLMLIAIALAILAGSLKTLEGIETEDIVKGITTLAVALGVMIAGMMIIDKFNVTGGMRVSVTLIALAAAVNLMADALKKISELKPEELSRGISGLAVVTASLAAAIIVISKWGGKVKVGSLQLLALATSIVILADAVKTMSEIDTGSLFISIGALTLIFAQLAIFLKVVDKTKFGVGSAVGLLAVAGAVQIMVSAIQRISGIDIPGLVKGLSTIAIILAQIVIFSKLAGGPSIIAAGAGLLIIAAALNLLVIPIMTFANMSWEELAKGLTGMAVALLAVAAAGLLASGTIGGAIAIVAMAGALNLLMAPILAFSQLTWGELLIGLGGLGLSLAVVAGASMLLAPAVPAMLAFGASVAILGIGMLAAGAGIALFAAGLGGLAAMTATAIAAIVASLAMLIKGLADLIPGFVDFVVKLGLALINGIVALVPPLANGIAKLIVSLLTTITTYLPSFIEKGTLLIMQLLEGMGKAVPTLISGALAFIVQLIDGLAQGIRDNGPALVGAMMELMGELVIIIIETGVALINALFGWIPGVQSATAEIGTTATEYIRDNFKATDVGNEKGKDFAGALGSKTGDAKNAGSKVGKAGKDGADAANLKTVGSQKGADYIAGLSARTGGAQGAGTKVGNAGKTGADSANLKTVGSGAGQDFISGLSSKVSGATTSGKSIANGGKSGAGSVSMNSTGANFGSGFASGISSAYNSVVSSAKSLARSAANTVKNWLDIHSPSRVTKSFGQFFGQGLALGIDDKVKTVSQSAKTLAVKATESLNKFLDGFQLPKDDNELKFKAVVDYDKLDSSKFGKLKPFTVQPDTSLTSGLVTATKVERRQNDNQNPTGDVDNSKSEVHNHYEVKVEDKGYKSRGEIRKLAEQIQTEIKNINDRGKISRGEGVAF
jgi:tape measure domain-containing protein